MQREKWQLTVGGSTAGRMAVTSDDGDSGRKGGREGGGEEEEASFFNIHYLGCLGTHS